MSEISVSSYFFSKLVGFLEPLFKVDDPNKLAKFKAAVDQYSYYTFTVDSLIDNEIDFINEKQPRESKLVKANILNTSSLRTLVNLFNEKNEFWDLFDSYMSSYYTGLILEKQDSNLRSKHTLESFRSYALAKHAPAFIPAEGMLLLFESKADRDTLKDLLIPIFYGMQMLDDLEDFNSDLQNAQHTYCISRVQLFMEEEQITNEKNLNRLEERVFYISGIAQECNNFATHQFEDAKEKAKQLALPELVVWIDQMLAMLAHNQQIITEVSK